MANLLWLSFIFYLTQIPNIMLTHKGTVALTTARLTLRRFVMEDAEAMYRTWASDPVVTQYLTWEPHGDVGVTKQVLGAWINEYPNEGYYNWGIEFEGRLIGGISIVLASQQNEWAEVGYCIGRAYWGRGIVTEALGRVLAFLFAEIGVHRVYLQHDVDNLASGRVMQKNGLQYEGTLRGHSRRRDGRFADLKVFGILKEEWAAQTAKER